jgi:hypothetical protein
MYLNDNNEKIAVTTGMRFSLMVGNFSWIALYLAYKNQTIYNDK